MTLKHTLIGLVVLVLGGLGIRWLAHTGQTQAPDLSITTLQGDKLHMQALRGRPVLVNFWATTCPGCARELPHLIELYQELSPQGLQILGIAMAYDPPNHVIALSQAKNIPYPVALDIQGKAAKAFGDIHLTPTSVLIAPDGRIILRKTGQLDIDRVRALILASLTPVETENTPAVRN